MADEPEKKSNRGLVEEKGSSMADEPEKKYRCPILSNGCKVFGLARKSNDASTYEVRGRRHGHRLRRGFDVDVFEDKVIVSLYRVRDAVFKQHYRMYEEAAEFAITQYNEQNDSKLELAKVLKVNEQMGTRIYYYLTLEAKEKDAYDRDTTKIYQTKDSFRNKGNSKAVYSTSRDCSIFAWLQACIVESEEGTAYDPSYAKNLYYVHGLMFSA
ncbi:hypothetical protein AKJ16_DCAP08422 [Drosera capensis]